MEHPVLHGPRWALIPRQALLGRARLEGPAPAPLMAQQGRGRPA